MEVNKAQLATEACCTGHLPARGVVLSRESETSMRQQGPVDLGQEACEDPSSVNPSRRRRVSAGASSFLLLGSKMTRARHDELASGRRRRRGSRQSQMRSRPAFRPLHFARVGLGLVVSLLRRWLVSSSRPDHPRLPPRCLE